MNNQRVEELKTKLVPIALLLALIATAVSVVMEFVPKAVSFVSILVGYIPPQIFAGYIPPQI